MTEALVLEKLSRCKISLRQKNPYFAVLTLFANYQFDESIELADTDGLIVRLNPSNFLALSDAVCTALLLHITLHAALLHPLRQSSRNPELWNIACDVMVNHIISTQTSFLTPPGTVTAKDISIDFTPLSSEQIYEYLLQHRKNSDDLIDAMNQREQGGSGAGSNAAGQARESSQMQADQVRKNSLAAAMANRFGKTAAASKQSEAPTKDAHAPKSVTAAGKLLRDIRPINHQTGEEAVRHHWETALLKAREQEAMRSQGKNKSSWLKELEAACNPQVDWRNLLSRFVIRTPTDFCGLDRRFIHAGLYLEMLEQETVQLDVAIDTSGSIQPSELNLFITELRGILSMYPTINCQIYYCDTTVYGPYPVNASIKFPQAEGGGGTDFCPFFELLNKAQGEREIGAVIYFTDGKGDFPAERPSYPVLWVAVPGAIDSDEFPFGQVIRLV